MLTKSRLIIERGSAIFPKYQKATKGRPPRRRPRLKRLRLQSKDSTHACQAAAQTAQQVDREKVQFPNIRSASRPRLHKHHIFSNRRTAPMCTKTDDNRRHHSLSSVCGP